MYRRPTLGIAVALLATIAPHIPPALRAQTPVIPAGVTMLPANDAGACLRCHAMPNFGFRESAYAPPRRLSVDPGALARSAHGRIGCQNCHPDVRTFPHTTPRRRVTCADDCHASDSTGAPFTHRAVVATFAASAHRRGLDGSNRDAPGCASCHGGDAHAIVPMKGRIAPSARMKLCADCHDDEARMRRNDVAVNAVASYRRSFHYKSVHFGGAPSPSTAVCEDCHTTHGVLPADSARSSVARGNVASTCGRSDCHPGAQMSFAMSGANHLDLRIERSVLLMLEERFFVVLTVGTMAMLAVGITMDLIRRARGGRQS
jgi:hypothetical protein